jgi:oligopeptide transport system permease protein
MRKNIIYVKRKGGVHVIKYVGKRLFYALLTVLTLTVLTFFMMRMLPGDPFIGAKAIPEATMEALNRKYGLDKPVLEQLIIYISNAFKGDLGVSIKYNRPITDIISQAFPYSLDLGIRALIFATITGVLLGIVAAVKRGTKWDSITMIFAIIGVSVPSFIVGSLLQYFFGLKLYQWTGTKFFPITGWNSFASKILPSFALSFSSLATISRLMRTSMLDVLGQDYIKTAKSKGLSQKKIIWKHAVRNAIMPVITVLGPIAASVLTGAFVVENIFSIPGMGKFFVMSIQDQDYTMISGITLFYGIFLVVANLIVDLAYGFIDPRVKLTTGKE